MQRDAAELESGQARIIRHRRRETGIDPVSRKVETVVPDIRIAASVDTAKDGAIQRESVDWDPDSVDVQVTGGYDVSEDQRQAIHADIWGTRPLVADLQPQVGVAAVPVQMHLFAVRDGDVNAFTEAVLTGAGSGPGQDRDIDDVWGPVDAVARPIGEQRVVESRFARAAFVGDGTAVETKGIVRDGDSIVVIVAASDGVLEHEFSGRAPGSDIGGFDNLAAGPRPDIAVLVKTQFE